MEHQDLLVGLIRLHVLHHAAEEEIHGQWIMQELARHGYRLGPGTLYPMLHGMEKKGHLCSREKRIGRSVRRLYRATPKGVKALAVTKDKLPDLVGELIDRC